MSGDKRTRLKQWLESGEARLHPLALPQRELWENSVVPVSDPAQQICCLIKVGGLLAPEDCRAALQQVVGRQEALRLSFLPGKDQPLQLVRKSGEANMHFRELAPAETGAEAIEERAREIFQQPFDLVQGPLYRVEGLRRAANDHVLVLSIHHAIADGWTLGVFVRDLCGAYVQAMMGVREPLPPVELPYTAWAAAERAAWPPGEVEKRAGFWRETLAGSSLVWNDAAAQSPLRRWASLVPADLAKAVRSLAKRTGATLFSTLLAVFQMTLARRLGIDELTVGAPVANRAKPKTRETMGYFSGVVPLRCRLDRAQSVLASVQATHQVTMEAFANAMPFSELVQALGGSDESSHPIYDVRFALQNHPVPDVSVPQLSARLRMRSSGTPRCEFGCEVTEKGEELETVWLFRENRFSSDDISALDRMFLQMLAHACDAPEGRLFAILK